MSYDNLPLVTKMLTAGVSASFADFMTFPLDTAKVRLQIQGEAKAVLQNGSVSVLRTQQQGLLSIIVGMVRTEGSRSLYKGLSAGLQRQMCFASVRIGFYDNFKQFYTRLFSGENATGLNVGARIAAGLTTGGLAVCMAQPTDVVKVRMQAAKKVRYTSTLQAYRQIGKNEGVRGLWKGTLPNIGRNAIVNVSEIVCYDLIKDTIIYYGLMKDGVPLHLTSGLVAGFCTTVVASPIDVVKTRYMNSPSGQYSSAVDCAIRMGMQEGAKAFYKGFVPSFCRLVSWNVVMWVTYEQAKIFAGKHF
ncbi:hypothetical protein PPYR_03490 [Photinus pyralis]|uniref:Mitochondrial brown fat uncoupling protein 1 n=1 Tax=Photinus pyralis TaxID=7054 RepID=A0A1Y1MN36_PHOPY|nr:mitochondrial uncoupling protein 2-like [Photinus pyralis]KAB0791690.1 hypothetical protein PPYR_03490 [Photinus pyralis]